MCECVCRHYINVFAVVGLCFALISIVRECICGWLSSCSFLDFIAAVFISFFSIQLNRFSRATIVELSIFGDTYCKTQRDIFQS